MFTHYSEYDSWEVFLLLVLLLLLLLFLCVCVCVVYTHNGAMYFSTHVFYFNTLCLHDVYKHLYNDSTLLCAIWHTSCAEWLPCMLRQQMC